MLRIPLSQPEARKVPLELKDKDETKPLWPLALNRRLTHPSLTGNCFSDDFKTSSNLKIIWTMPDFFLRSFPVSSSPPFLDSPSKLADSKAAILDCRVEPPHCLSETINNLTILERFSLSGCWGTYHTLMHPSVLPLLHNRGEISFSIITRLLLLWKMKIYWFKRKASKQGWYM